jgi:hypothetical protein
MSADEWRAWSVLGRDGSSIEGLYTTYDHMVVLNEFQRFFFKIPILNHPVPGISLEISNLPEGTQEVMHNFIMRYQSSIGEMEVILDNIAVLCNLCATPGHIRRVWPDLLGFMHEGGKDRILNAGAKSPYPDGIVNYHDGEVQERWRPENLEWMNIVFVEAMVLPPYGETEADSYPQFTRY